MLMGVNAHCTNLAAILSEHAIRYMTYENYICEMSNAPYSKLKFSFVK